MDLISKEVLVIIVQQFQEEQSETWVGMQEDTLRLAFVSHFRPLWVSLIKLGPLLDIVRQLYFQIPLSPVVQKNYVSLL